MSDTYAKLVEPEPNLTLSLTDSGVTSNYNTLLRLWENLGLDPVLIRYFKDNKKVDYVDYAGLRNAPASKFNHHSFTGGLVLHYLEMFELHATLEEKHKVPSITSKDVMEAIVLHDLHKAHLTFTYISSEQRFRGTKDYKKGQFYDYGPSKFTRIAGANEQTLIMCMEAGYKIRNPLVMNALLSSEGGYAKNPPKCVSAFAKYIYVLDELSSNVYARYNKGNAFDVFTGESCPKTFNE